VIAWEGDFPPQLFSVFAPDAGLLWLVGRAVPCPPSVGLEWGPSAKAGPPQDAGLGNGSAMAANKMSL